MVSIVVPAYNEEKVIASCLRALSKQKTNTSYEVIVVDNNSTDKTAQVTRSFKGISKLKIIKEKTQGIGPAKAKGASVARGTIIAFIDADTEAPENWISVIAKHFETSGTVGLTGPWTMEGVTGIGGFILNNCQKLAMSPLRIVYGDYSLNGMNFAVRASTYKKVGGIDRSLKVHEDLDLASRLRKLGKLVYASELKVKTSPRRYKKGFLAGLMEYQINAIKVFLLGKKDASLKNIR